MRVQEPVTTIDMEAYTQSMGTRVLVRRLYELVQASDFRTPFLDRRVNADIESVVEAREELDNAERSGDSEAIADASQFLTETMEDAIEYWVNRADEAGYRVDYVAEQYTYAVYAK